LALENKSIKDENAGGGGGGGEEDVDNIVSTTLSSSLNLGLLTLPAAIILRLSDIDSIAHCPSTWFPFSSSISSQNAQALSKQ